jgi:predicted acyltransferase
MANVGIQQNLQMLVTNEFRGRVMGVWSIVHSSVRPMGEMQFSALAALVSAPFSLIASGVMVIGAALFLSTYKRPTRHLMDLREEAAEAGRMETRVGGPSH